MNWMKYYIYGRSLVFLKIFSFKVSLAILVYGYQENISSLWLSNQRLAFEIKNRRTEGI